MFPTRVRFSGSAFGNNIGVGIVGGVAPLLATWLISITGFQAAPAIYLMVVCLLTVVSTFWLPRYLGQILL
jgi:MHS family proline/betaine transporter-like MFS transporter